jgi:PRC-barrel domain
MEQRLLAFVLIQTRDNKSNDVAKQAPWLLRCLKWRDVVSSFDAADPHAQEDLEPIKLRRLVLLGFERSEPRPHTHVIVEDAVVTKPISLIIFFALALGGAVYAQPQAPPDPSAAATPGTTNPSRSDPSTATPGVVSPSPIQSDQVGRAGRPTSQSDRNQSTEPTTGGKHNLSAGAIVQSPVGESIGTVKDVVPDPDTGQPIYILVATPSGGSTAIPYSTIAPMISNGRIILDRSRLEGAPRVSDTQLRDKSNKAWQQKAQAYWNARAWQ